MPRVELIISCRTLSSTRTPGKVIPQSVTLMYYFARKRAVSRKVNRSLMRGAVDTFASRSLYEKMSSSIPIFTLAQENMSK